MSQHLFVWLRRADGALQPIGELAATSPARSSGHFESEFEYDRSWANRADAFALDPVLQARVRLAQDEAYRELAAHAVRAQAEAAAALSAFGAGLAEIQSQLAMVGRILKDVE